jgi:hypothetical protein
MIANRFVSTFLALGLALAPTALIAAPAQKHSGTIELTLDHGKKWPTDAALRNGMNEIRATMADAIPSIHADKFSPDSYKGLAQQVQAQVDGIVANCKLPEAADQQLHLVLEQILDGIAVMNSDARQAEGAGKVVQALDQYGAHFDHAKWRPLER